MNKPKSNLIAVIIVLLSAAVLAGAAPALAGSLTLYEVAAGSTIEIGGRGLHFTNAPDGVTLRAGRLDRESPGPLQTGPR